MVTPCDTPASSLIAGDVAAADYREAYRLPLSHPDMSLPDLFFALFGHHPGWLKGLLVARHGAGRALGLAGASAGDILHPTPRNIYAVGETIGPWPIFALERNELVVGRDNAHLDFRVSILKEEGGASAAVSTLCHARNRMGRAYLALILPFHRAGMRHLLDRAVAAGRL